MNTVYVPPFGLGKISVSDFTTSCRGLSGYALINCLDEIKSRCISYDSCWRNISSFFLERNDQVNLIEIWLMKK